MCIERILYVLYIVLLSTMVWFIRMEANQNIVINVIPLQTIRLYIEAWAHDYAPLPVIFANLFGNIILTIPLGMMVFRILGKVHHLIIWIIAFYLPMHIESIQLFLYVVGYSTRTVDIDDVLLNGIGILIGYYIFLVNRQKNQIHFP